MIIGTRYKDDLVADEYDVIVIGSGISGLAVAALQSLQGKSVLVLEKHTTAGGMTHTYRRLGCEWDSGLHYLGEVHKPDHMLRIVFDAISGNNLKWAKMPPEYDRVVYPDMTFSFLEGREALEEQLLRQFPVERKAITQYFRLIGKVAKTVGHMAYGKILPRPLAGVSDLFTSTGMFRRSTYDVLRTLTSDERLISVLTAQWGDYGLPPRQSSFGVHGTVAQHYLDGGNFPVGGSSEVARTIVAGIEARGGKVIVNAGVAQVLTERDRATGVLLENGRLIRAKKIVSSIGLLPTYLHLFKDDQIPPARRKEVSQLPLSLSYLSITALLKTEATLEGHKGGNIWVYQGYDHDENMRKYFAAPLLSPPPMQFLSFPSLKDPSWKKRMGTKTPVTLMGVAPFEWFQKWEGSRRRPADYQEHKEALARPYLQTLQTLFPGSSQDLEAYEVSSPLTMKHYGNNVRGEIYGRSLGPERFTREWARPATPLKGFYLTGQDILMNGVAASMMSGVLTSTVMEPLSSLTQLNRLGLFSRS